MATEDLERTVLDAYFATKKEALQLEGTQDVYTVKSGDSLSKIARKKGTTVQALRDNNHIKGDLILIGQKLNITQQTKKGNKVTFERLNQANLGDEVYVIVKTSNLQGKEITINVKQGKVTNPTVETQGNGLMLLQNGVGNTLAKAVVGNFANKNEITNADDFKDWAIFKVILGGIDNKDEAAALEQLEDKKAYLFLLVDAHSQNNIEVVYNGHNPDNEGNVNIQTIPNYWLDIEGKWFELKKPNDSSCYCNRDLTEEEVKKLVNKEALFEHKACPVPKEKRSYKEFTKQLNATFKKYEINTCLRKAHFIAQTEAESDHYKTTIEYASGWDYDHTTYEEAYHKYELYLKDKENNKAYNTSTNRLGHSKYKIRLSHGHNVKGYGPKYKGKGLIQLTWKDTYEKYFKHLGKPELIKTPEKVAEDLFYTFDSAGWYWNHGSAWGNMNTKADHDDLIAVSIGINGGMNGYDYRKKNLKRILKEMKVKETCKCLKTDKPIGVYTYETSTIKNSRYGKKERIKEAIQKFDD